MRLLNSITGLAGDVAEYMADRIDNAAENVRGEAPGAVDWQARATTAEESLTAAATRINELERQLEAHHHADARTPAHRQTVLIEGLLAAVERGTHPLEHPLDVPPGLAGRVAKALAPSYEAENLRRELSGMYQRERQVDQVVDAWDTERGNLKGYHKVGTLDPETPAGRVVELLRALTQARPRTTESLTADRAALDAIHAELRKYGLLSGSGGGYGEAIAESVCATLTEYAAYRHELHAIDVALTKYDKGESPINMAVDLAKPSGRVVGAVHTLMYQLEQAATTAAADINKVAEAAEQAAAVTDAIDEADAAAADGFIKGLRAAAHIAVGDTPEVDPNVAHIDTVNARGAHAQATTDPQESE